MGIVRKVHGCISLMESPVDGVLYSQSCPVLRWVTWRRGLVPPGQSRFLNGTILKNASKDYRLIHLAFANHPLFLYICIFFYCSVNAHQRTINALWDAEDRVEELENHEVESISTLHRQIRKLRCKYLPYYLKISLSYYFILFH